MNRMMQDQAEKEAVTILTQDMSRLSKVKGILRGNKINITTIAKLILGSLQNIRDIQIFYTKVPKYQRKVNKTHS